jgi:hypothetical protein
MGVHVTICMSFTHTPNLATVLSVIRKIQGSVHGPGVLDVMTEAFYEFPYSRQVNSGNNVVP